RDGGPGRARRLAGFSGARLHDRTHDRHAGPNRPRPRGRRAPQARRRRTGRGDRPAARHGRGAHARLDGRRGAAPDADERARDVLEQVAAGVLAQGRHVRARAGRALGRPRLRRRRAARARAPGRGRVPHRDADVLRGRGRPGRRRRRPARRRRRRPGRTRPRPRGGEPVSATVDPAETTVVPAGGPAWGETWPVPDGFRALAASRRVIPVVRRLLADDVTPVGLYRTLAQGRPGTFVLESAESDGRWARYSFVGVASRATLTARDGRAVWSGDVPAGVPLEGDVVDVLEATLDVLRTPAVAGLPPLTGGLAGAIGWDVIRHWEPTLPSDAPDELGVPELTLCLATDLAVVDHAEGSVWLVANAINFDDTDERVDDAYADAVARLDAMQARPVAGGAHVASVVSPDAAEPELEFRSTREEFEASVVAGKDAIREGEVFQVVLSQRLDLDCPAEPLDVYRALRTINPSPYMYYFQLTDADGR